MFLLAYHSEGAFSLGDVDGMTAQERGFFLKRLLKAKQDYKAAVEESRKAN
jgi:hypothetical protein